VQSVIDEKGHYEGKDTPVSRHQTLRDLWQGLVADGLISQVRPLYVFVGGWEGGWMGGWVDGWEGGWLAG